jgi:hypothetical protein
MIQILRVIAVLSLIGTSVIIGQCVIHKPQDAAARAGLSVMDRFGQMSSNGLSRGAPEQVSPLVQQAQAFALYLNPPAAGKRDTAHPASPTEQSKSLAKAATQVKPESTSAKFELRGISYHRARPEESMALISEPGSGSRWVRQGDQVGHIVVKEINGDSVVCRDGSRELAMNLAIQQNTPVVAKAVEKKPTPALPKKNSQPTGAISRPVLVRGMRQIPPARVAAYGGQTAEQSLNVTAQ